MMLSFSTHPLHRRAKGFTLVELLVSISIITLLAAMILVALAGVQENAKTDRTRAQIARIDALISEQWETYRNRRLPVNLLSTQSQDLPLVRLNMVRELMRVELPDRKSDIVMDPVLSPAPFNRNALQRSYRRKAAKMISQKKGVTFPNRDGKIIAILDENWSKEYQSAECLYLILSQMTTDDKAALEFFNDREIGDIDNDGMPEILDGWRRPIMFLRWAPGYAGAGSLHNVEVRDPFDVRNVHDRYCGNRNGPELEPRRTFALYPLIFSGGPDLQYEIYSDEPSEATRITYAYTADPLPNNPFRGWLPLPSESGIKMIGVFQDSNADGRDGSLDNITNHGLVAN